MPIYAYKCKACSYEFDETQRFADKPLVVCPNCKKRQLVRLIGGAALVFKGSGFYLTDYKNKSSGDSESKSSPKKEPKSESKGESKGESKAESKGESRGDSKGESKGESKAESKGESSSDGKSDAKTEDSHRRKGGHSKS